jgi:hypothetical protein
MYVDGFKFDLLCMQLASWLHAMSCLTALRGCLLLSLPFVDMHNLLSVFALMFCELLW